MVKNIIIENFRCFEKEQDIPIKPLTLIYGANSSGKSSILKAIMALKQTYEFKESANEVFIGNGEFVDIGGFRDFVNNKEKPFCIEKEFEYKELVRRRPDHAFTPKSLDLKNISIKYHYNLDKNNKLILELIKIFAKGKDEHKTLLISLEKTIDPKTIGLIKKYHYFSRARTGLTNSSPQNIYKVKKVNSEFLLELLDLDFSKSPQKLSILEKLDSIISRYNVDAQLALFEHPKRAIIDRAIKYKNFFEMGQSEAKEQYLDEMNNFIKNSYAFIFDSLWLYPVPLERDDVEINLFDIGYDERFFIPDDDSENCKEYFGAMFAIDIRTFVESLNRQIEKYLEGIKYIGPLRKMPERYYNFSHSSSDYVGKAGENTANILAKNPKIKNKINNKLRRFDIGYQVRTQKLKEDLYYLSLQDTESEQKVQVAINDVGFGISQILPIILQSFSSKRESIFIEQPEIHLHPKLQAELGELFVESYKENKNSFIIETHSETLMLRIQKLIRSGKLSNNDVSVIYVDKTSFGSECIPLELNSKGEFKQKWPNGFFEEAFNELL